MTNKKTDEYKIQYRITSRLNKIVATDDKKNRKELSDELLGGDVKNHSML